MNLRSYASKMWVIIAAWVLLIWAIFGGILTKSTHDFYYGYTSEENEELTETAVGVAAYIESLPDISAAQSQFVFLSNLLKYDLLATDSNGVVILSTNRLRSWNGITMTAADMQTLSNGKYVTYTGNIPEIKKKVLKVAVPLIKDNKKIGAVFVIEPLTYVEAVEYSVIHSIQWVLGLSFLLAIPLGLYLARRLARPVIEMDEAIKDIATGNYARAIPLNTTAEFASLGQSVNTMSTEIRQQLAAINYERNQLANVLSSIEDGVITISPQGEILMANRVALKMFAESPKSLKIDENELPSVLRSFLEQSLQQRKLLEGEFTNLGEVYKIAASPLLTNEEYAGLVVVWHNITKEKRMESIRREFVQNVSHELRTPLSYLQGYTEALLDGILKDEIQRRHYLETILQETLRLRRLVDDLLDYNRIENTKIKLIHEKVSVPDTMKLVKNEIEPLSAKKKIRLIFEWDENLPPVDCSYDRLHQILLNLVDNAIHISEENSEIRVSAEELNQKVQISVADQGPGIPPEELDLVWNRFERGRYRSNSKGSGLGLAIVKSLVESYNGEVGLQSELGKGTTFLIMLPIIQL